MSSAVVANVGQNDSILYVKNDVKDSCPSGWTPIPNVEEPWVQEVANFAGAKYNIEYGGNLKYKCTLRGWYREPKEGGLDYGLILEMADLLGCVGKYKVFVSEKKCGCEKIRKLEAFKPIPKN